MLCTRRPTLAALGSLAAPVKAPNKQQQSTMAKATRTIWVKGDPQQQVLGDCPFCHRALLTLEMKGLDYNKEYIDFSDKPKWLFDLTEKGTVPVLKDADEKMIPDSGDICEYLAKKYPDPDLGKCTLEGVGDKLFPSFVNFLTKGEEEKENEQALLDNLQEIEDYLAKNGPYLGGSQMAAYDAMVFPRLYHLTTALDAFKGWKLPDKFTNIKDYIDRVKQTEPFKNTDYGQEMILNGWRPKVEA